MGSCGTSVQHLPYPHGPCQLRGVVRNALPGDHGQSLEARLSQEGSTPYRALNVTRPNTPGDLDHEVDVVRTLTPLAPDYYVGLCKVIHTVLGEASISHSSLQDCNEIVEVLYCEGHSPTNLLRGKLATRRPAYATGPGNIRITTWLVPE